MKDSSIIVERYLQDSEKYLEEANKMYSQNSLSSAEEYLFLAAERIEQLLPYTPYELLENRVHLLEEISNFIDRIQQEMAGQTGNEKESIKQAQGKSKDEDDGASKTPLFSVEEKPTQKLADVAGMPELKELIRTKLIYPLKDPETTQIYGVKRGAGILLYGPPGTGKSMIARAIAGEFDAAFISIKASDVLDSLYGQTEKNIAALFEQAKKYDSAVIFIDEMDGLGGDRDASDSHMRRFINQLLVELQGFSNGLENIIVLGATNKPWLLDKALIRSGRMDDMFYVPLPDAATRREIWQLNLEGKIVDDDVDLEALVISSEGLSGADIARICDKANTEAYRLAIRTKSEVPISQEGLIKHFPAEPIKFHQEDLNRLEAFAKLYDHNNPHFSREPGKAPKSPDSCQAPHDLATFWRAIFMVLPCEDGLPEKLSKFDDILDFVTATELLTKALKSKTDVKTKRVNRLAFEDFENALKSSDESKPPKPKKSGLQEDFDEDEQKTENDKPTSSDPSPAAKVAPSLRSDSVLSPDATLVPTIAATDKPLTALPLSIPVINLSQPVVGIQMPIQNESIAAILKRGQELLDIFGNTLLPPDRKQVMDELYRRAQQCQKIEDFDEVKFSEFIFGIRDGSQVSAPTPSDIAIPPVLPNTQSPPALTQTVRLEAMKILNEYYHEIGTEWKGFMDTLRDAREIDLDGLRKQVKALAEDKAHLREQQAFDRLFAENRSFLDEALINELEQARQMENPNFVELTKKVEEKTYGNFVDKVLDDALARLKFSPQRARRLKRKAARSITRQKLRPTPDSARNMLIWADHSLRKLEQEHRNGKVASAAAIVEDVHSLILPSGLIDFSDVAGMTLVKNQLEDAMDRCLNNEKRELFIRKVGREPLTLAVLLYGSPGNGKTFIAKAAAGEFAQKYNFTVMHVPHDAIRSLHYMKKLTRIRQIFELAREKAPTLVIWDEFDEIATPPRFSGRKYDADVCATLKQEFEGAIQGNKIVLHVATCNHPWQIDNALLRGGRLGHHVHVTPPDLIARKEFLTIFNENGDLADDVDFDKLAELTEGMTIAEIREICEAAANDVFDHAATVDPNRKFETTDFVRQIEANPPRHLQTWLAEVEAAFRGKYACQKPLFPGLMKEIELMRQRNNP